MTAAVGVPAAAAARGVDAGDANAAADDAGGANVDGDDAVRSPSRPFGPFGGGKQIQTRENGAKNTARTQRMAKTNRNAREKKRKKRTNKKKKNDSTSVCPKAIRGDCQNKKKIAETKNGKNGGRPRKTHRKLTPDAEKSQEVPEMRSKK